VTFAGAVLAVSEGRPVAVEALASDEHLCRFLLWLGTSHVSRRAWGRALQPDTARHDRAVSISA